MNTLLVGVTSLASINPGDIICWLYDDGTVIDGGCLFWSSDYSGRISDSFPIEGFSIVISRYECAILLNRGRIISFNMFTSVTNRNFDLVHRTHGPIVMKKLRNDA